MLEVGFALGADVVETIRRKKRTMVVEEAVFLCELTVMKLHLLAQMKEDGWTFFFTDFPHNALPDIMSIQVPWRDSAVRVEIFQERGGLVEMEPAEGVEFFNFKASMGFEAGFDEVIGHREVSGFGVVAGAFAVLGFEEGDAAGDVRLS